MALLIYKEELNEDHYVTTEEFLDEIDKGLKIKFLRN